MSKNENRYLDERIGKLWSQWASIISDVTPKFTWYPPRWRNSSTKHLVRSLWGGFWQIMFSIGYRYVLISYLKYIYFSIETFPSIGLLPSSISFDFFKMKHPSTAYRVLPQGIIILILTLIQLLQVNQGYIYSSYRTCTITSANNLFNCFSSIYQPLLLHSAGVDTTSIANCKPAS